jgi:hypothetical protein
MDAPLHLRRRDRHENVLATTWLTRTPTTLSLRSTWKLLYKRVTEDEHPKVMADRRRTVLHVSPDPALARSRTKALTSIGYEVTPLATVVAALFEISFGLRSTGALS